jgi:hypothetical protein
MGLWSTIKGWFNRGGVRIAIVETEKTFCLTDPILTGTVRLSTSSRRRVKNVEVTFVLQRTTGRGEERRTEEEVIGRYSITELLEHSYPIEMKAGETRDEMFVIHVDPPDDLPDPDEEFGGSRRAALLLGSETREYYLVAKAEVENTPLPPTDRMTISVVDQ